MRPRSPGTACPRSATSSTTRRRRRAGSVSPCSAAPPRSRSTRRPSLWNQIDVSTDAIVPHFREFADRIHRHGAKLMCQLTHMGRRTRWDAGDWITPVSSSVVREPAHNCVPKEAEEHDIRAHPEGLRRRGRALRRGRARRLRDPLREPPHLAVHHAAREPAAPTPTAAALENRLRFGIEVLEQVREAVGPDFVVGMRMTGDEMVKDGHVPRGVRRSLPPRGRDGARRLPERDRRRGLHAQGARRTTCRTWRGPEAPYLDLAKRSARARRASPSSTPAASRRPRRPRAPSTRAAPTWSA